MTAYIPSQRCRRGRVAYKDYRPQRRTHDIIDKINRLADEYMQRDRTLTVRQVHYQFVGRGWGANTQAHYDAIQRIIAEARLGGLLTWDVIVDRTRHVRDTPTWDDEKAFLADAAWWFTLDRWASQPNRVEVWIEKDALGGIVAEAVRDLGTPWFSMRGNTSVTALREAAVERIVPRFDEDGQRTNVLLLTDHDASGLKMFDVVSEDLALFAPPVRRPGSFDGDPRVVVRRIGLTWEQVHNRPTALPPNFNPEDQNTLRRWYQQKVGTHESWELDAVPPDELIALIRSEVESYIDDRHGWSAVEAKERDTRELLLTLGDRWDDVLPVLDA